MTDFVDADRLCGENKYHCSGCDKKVNALKFTSVDTSPRVLMVDFKRYNLGRKNQEIIQYPSSFSLKKYLSSSIDKRNASKIGHKLK